VKITKECLAEAATRDTNHRISIACNSCLIQRIVEHVSDIFDEVRDSLDPSLISIITPCNGLHYLMAKLTRPGRYTYAAFYYNQIDNEFRLSMMQPESWDLAPFEQDYNRAISSLSLKVRSRLGELNYV
jgi:hypothetical protein